MSFDFPSYCATPESTTDVAVCSLYNTTADAIAAFEGEDIGGLRQGLNTFFMLFAGALVFMMQAGFAMLCAGSVRQKNVKNIMLKNLLDACGGAIGFYTVGFAFAYGGDSSGDVKNFIGNTYFGLRNYPYSELHNWFFQFAFAATAATIVAGTVAERCKMSAYLCYSLFLTGFVYPVVVHSVWNASGFLSAFNADPFRGVGAVDFAGSGVVHLTGGATALVAAIILGPRKGRFYDEDGLPLEEPVQFQAHSVALQILGTFILWFGWYGFNPGSALVIDSAASGSTAGLAMVTTTLAAACGCVTAMFTDSIIEMRRTGEVTYDLTMAMNGALGGLVGITAGTATVDPWASTLIGAIGGLVYLGASKLLIKLRIDDAVDAIPVHCANGIWGVISTGLFSRLGLMDTAGFGNPGRHQGWFFDGSDGNLLLCQFCQVLWVCTWTMGLMTPFFYVLRAAGMFRVDPLEEEVGLDISHHRGAAYDLTGPAKEDVEELLEVRASKHGKVEVPREVAKAAEEAQGDV